MAAIIYPPFEGPGIFDLAIQGGAQNDVAITPDAGIVRITNSAPIASVTFASATPLIANTTDGTAFATAAFTPTAVSDYLIFVGNTKATTPDLASAFTATNFSTPQLLASVTNAAGTGRVAVYRCHSISSPASLALTVTFPATQTGCFISVVAVTGNVAQFAPHLMVCSTPAAATAATSPLSLTGLGTNATTIGGCLQIATATAPALPAGYTDLHNGTIATPSTGWRTQLKTASDDTFAFNGTGTADLIGIAVGINPAIITPSINGFAGGYPGRRITVKNNSTPAIGQQHAAYDTFLLQPENTGSVAANRILTPSGDSLGTRSFMLQPGASVDLIYDGNASRWVVNGLYDGDWDTQGLTALSRDVVISARALTLQGIDTLNVNPLVRLYDGGTSPTQADASGQGKIDIGDGISSPGGSPASAYIYYAGDGLLGLGPNVTVDTALKLAGTRPEMAALLFANSSGTITGTGDTVLRPNGTGPLGGTRDRYIMPWAGRIIAITLQDGSSRTAGTLTGIPLISGVSQVQPNAIIDGTNVASKATAVAYVGGAIFAAGDSIGMIATGSAFTPVANNLLGVVYVIFDAVA